MDYLTVDSASHLLYVPRSDHAVDMAAPTGITKLSAGAKGLPTRGFYLSVGGACLLGFAAGL